MSDRKAADCEKWVMVDDNGQRTLFRLVEMGKGTDAVQLARELAARTVVVDIALPALPALDEKPGKHPRSARSKLILLKVRTVTGDDAHGGMRIVSPQPKPLGIVAPPD
jgi:hypothetical protein